MSKHLIRVFPRDYKGEMKLYVAVNKEVSTWPDNIVFVPEDEAIRMGGICDSIKEAMEFMNLPGVKELWKSGTPVIKQWFIVPAYVDQL